MFVRWKRYARKTQLRWKNAREYEEITHTLLVAALVQSERRQGKPRQKVVAYLGSIREERLSEVLPREWFWSHAVDVLDRLGFDANQRAVVETALRQRVRRPSAEEVEAENRASSQFLQMCIARCR
jgi:hypothetical protein